MDHPSSSSPRRAEAPSPSAGAEIYWRGFRAVGVACGLLAALGGWGLAVYLYGWWVGLSVGWVPGVAVGLLGALLWPVVFGALLLGVGFVVYGWML